MLRLRGRRGNLSRLRIDPNKSVRLFNYVLTESLSNSRKRGARIFIRPPLSDRPWPIPLSSSQDARGPIALTRRAFLLAFAGAATRGLLSGRCSCALVGCFGQRNLADHRCSNLRWTSRGTADIGNLLAPGFVALTRRGLQKVLSHAPSPIATGSVWRLACCAEAGAAGPRWPASLL
jgi:hypothetical protein